MQNAYASLMGADVGDPREFVGAPIEIVGDRAVAVPDVDNPAKYLEGRFTVQDRIDVGFGNNATLAPGAVQQFAATISSPFKPEELTIPSWLAPDVSVMAIDIGSCRYIESGTGSGVPADQYSEVSNTRKVSWGTVQTQVPIQITLRNDTAAAVNVKFCIRGLRLRQ
jgi:hypothetical protein